MSTYQRKFELLSLSKIIVIVSLLSTRGGMIMIQSEIRLLLQKIAIQTRKTYANQLRELGLHIGQELALSYLWERDGITQSQLRHKTGSEASTISNMLKKLEQDDIVYRKQDEDDNRIHKVYLTEKGRDLQKPISAIWQSHEENMFGGFEPEDLLTMKQLLQQVKENLTAEN